LDEFCTDVAGRATASRQDYSGSGPPFSAALALSRPECIFFLFTTPRLERIAAGRHRPEAWICVMDADLEHLP
jgi:hypothetical protein